MTRYDVREHPTPAAQVTADAGEGRDVSEEALLRVDIGLLYILGY